MSKEKKKEQSSSIISKESTKIQSKKSSSVISKESTESQSKESSSVLFEESVLWVLTARLQKFILEIRILNHLDHKTDLYCCHFQYTEE